MTPPPALVARTGRWLCLLALAVYLFTAGGSMTTTDAVVAFDVAKNLVERGSVATSGDLLGSEALRGRDGRYYSPFGLMQSLYDVPFYLAGVGAARLTGLTVGKPDTIPKAVVALSQTLLVALTVWLVFTLSARVTGHTLAALMSALTCAFGSLLWPYSQFGFGQPLACATLLAAVASAHSGVTRQSARDLRWAGIWLAVSLMSRHEMGLAILPIGLWIASAGQGAPRWKARRLLPFAPGVVAGIVVWLLYNQLRFGHPFDSGHLRDGVPGFGSPILDGLLGLLFSPAASIFLYSPFVVFGAIGLGWLARDDKASAMLLGSLTALFLLFYATLGNWLGGRSYGGRYLLVVLPYLGVGWAVFLVRLPARGRRLAFVLVTAVGMALQVPGVLLDYAKISQRASVEAGAPSLEARQWDWSASPLVLNAAALPRQVSDNIAYALGRRVPPRVAPPAGSDDPSYSQQFAFSLDLWWLYLFHMGVLSRAGLLAVGVAFVLAIGACAARLHSAARRLADVP